MGLPRRLVTGPHQTPLLRVDERTLQRVRIGLTGLFHGPRVRYLAIAAIGEVWLCGYDVYPEELGIGIAIELFPRTLRTTDRPGRIELVDDVEEEPLRWRWSDTGDVLRVDPEDTGALVVEIDARLRPESERANTVGWPST